MRHLRLDRPLVVFDLESTGTDPSRDRVVEISAARFEGEDGPEVRTRRVNPERPIPAEATAVHGIRDEDVRDAPTFRQIARGLFDFLGDADLAGFNVRRFDAPLLDREFRNCGLDLGLERRRMVDAMTIYHRMERRDLSAAVRFYLGRGLEGAHSAEADVLATADVLDAQLARYPELPKTIDELDLWCRPPGAVDASGKFVWRDREAVFAFGRHDGRTLREVAEKSRDYLEWILRQDFPPDARAVVEAALRGEWPEAPAGREDAC